VAKKFERLAQAIYAGQLKPRKQAPPIPKLRLTMVETHDEEMEEAFNDQQGPIILPPPLYRELTNESDDGLPSWGMRVPQVKSQRQSLDEVREIVARENSGLNLAQADSPSPSGRGMAQRWPQTPPRRNPSITSSSLGLHTTSSTVSVGEGRRTRGSASSSHLELQPLQASFELLLTEGPLPPLPARSRALRGVPSMVRPQSRSPSPVFHSLRGETLSARSRCTTPVTPADLARPRGEGSGRRKPSASRPPSLSPREAIHPERMLQNLELERESSRTQRTPLTIDEDTGAAESKPDVASQRALRLEGDAVQSPTSRLTPRSRSPAALAASLVGALSRATSASSSPQSSSRRTPRSPMRSWGSPRHLLRTTAAAE